MQLEAKKYLFDIKQAADLLLRFSWGKTLREPLSHAIAYGQPTALDASGRTQATGLRLSLQAQKSMRDRVA